MASIRYFLRRLQEDRVSLWPEELVSDRPSLLSVLTIRAVGRLDDESDGFFSIRRRTKCKIHECASLKMRI
jgi:hypothetical protein